MHVWPSRLGCEPACCGAPVVRPTFVQESLVALVHQAGAFVCERGRVPAEAAAYDRLLCKCEADRGARPLFDATHPPVQNLGAHVSSEFEWELVHTLPINSLC
eukprot:1152561-Pelagomonas_calceolata.AAC.4